MENSFMFWNSTSAVILASHLYYNCKKKFPPNPGVTNIFFCRLFLAFPIANSSRSTAISVWVSNINPHSVMQSLKGRIHFKKFEYYRSVIG